MRFNIVNPSDPYTMEADDLEVAAVAVCLIGEGKYPLEALGDDSNKGNSVPAFLFGGHDEWFQARFGGTFEAVLTRSIMERTDALARALESVKLGSERRSSLNDIGARAQAYAQAVRERAVSA